MSKLLYGSIDVTKIDKSKLVTTDKDGNPFKNGAAYLNVSIWVNDDMDKYGHIASIQQSLSKEEREAGQKAAYIGNLKEYKSEEKAETKNDTEDKSSLPF